MGFSSGNAAAGEQEKMRQAFCAMQKILKTRKLCGTIFVCCVFHFTFITFKCFEDVVSIHEIGEHFELDKIYHTHDNYTRPTRCV